MKSEVETLSPTRVKLTVEVPSEDLKSHLDAAYKSIGQQISIPGFRKGKVPTRIIDAKVGRGAVLQEAINEALPEFYGQALAAGELQPLGQPEVDITEVPDPASGGELRFTAEVDVRPEITLPEYSALQVQLDPVEVSEEDVAARLDDLRARFGTLVGVDRPGAEGDFVSMDLSARIDGEEIDSATGLSYEIGSKTMLDGLDEALTGLSADEETTFEAELAGGEHAGKRSLITVRVAAVKERQLPPADDEFAEMASEFETIEELLADLRQQAEAQKRFQVGLGARDKVLEALLAACEVPIPAKVVEAEVNAHLEGEERLDDEVHRAEVIEEVTQSLRHQLVLDAVADAENVQVGQNELIEYLVQQAQMYETSPQEFADQVAQAGQLPAMMSEIRRRKGLAVILEQATIVDAEGNRTSLDELLPRPIEADADLEGADLQDAEDEGAAADQQVVEGADEQPVEAARADQAKD